MRPGPRCARPPGTAERRISGSRRCGSQSRAARAPAPSRRADRHASPQRARVPGWSSELQPGGATSRRSRRRRSAHRPARWLRSGPRCGWEYACRRILEPECAASRGLATACAPCRSAQRHGALVAETCIRCVPGAAQHEVMRCRPGTAKEAVFVAVPDQRRTVPPQRVEDARKRAYGSTLHRVRDTRKQYQRQSLEHRAVGGDRDRRRTVRQTQRPRDLASGAPRAALQEVRQLERVAEPKPRADRRQQLIHQRHR